MTYIYIYIYDISSLRVNRRILNIRSQRLATLLRIFAAVTPATGSFIPKTVVIKFRRQTAYRSSAYWHTFGHDNKRLSTTQPHPQHALSRTPLTSDVRTRCASGIKGGSLDILHRLAVCEQRNLRPSSWCSLAVLLWSILPLHTFLMGPKSNKGAAGSVTNCHFVLPWKVADVCVWGAVR